MTTKVIALKPAPSYTLNILLVEDSSSDAVLVRKALKKAASDHCHIQRVATLEEALRALRDITFDVALLDLSLPDSADFDGLLAIQNNAPKLPVIILTAYADEEMALKAVERGAQDYLFKDQLSGQVIQRAMHYAVQRKHFEATLITQANFDMLTGLANRTLFESRLDMALARARRTGAGVGIFFLDLNRFKLINDTLGHAAGDLLLKKAAALLKHALRPYDTAARFGGDEFALLIEGISQARDCASIAQKIIDRFAAPFQLYAKEIHMGVSIGIATCFPGEKVTRLRLMQYADEAMYNAKLSAHSTYRFYKEEVQEQASTRLKLEVDLHGAIQKNQLAIYYQPVLALDGGNTVELEALLRWNSPDHGLLLPREFLGVAEDIGMAGEIGLWVLRTVCADMARWKKNGRVPLRVSVNLSVGQLTDHTLAKSCGDILRQYDVAAKFIAFEVPNSAFVDGMEGQAPTLAALRAQGSAIYLDHFGASTISLNALKNVAVDAIKIPPELTKTLHDPDGMLLVVQAIMDIARRFNVEVIASGIENEWQKSFFKELGCAKGQGFALCRPVPEEYIAEWLSEYEH